MAMRDITELMNAYRECSRNLWNVYFSGRENIGGSLDAFEDIRRLLFDSLVLNELSYEGEAEGEDIPPPALKLVPRERTLILINRPSDDGNGYWDQEKDMVVGPNDIKLAFLDYFDFSQIPIMDFRYSRCKIISFPSRTAYEGREALIAAVDARVFHDEESG
jgi:hypothetical protein